jgi:CheY-like chemotaxis protein
MRAYAQQKPGGRKRAVDRAGNWGDVANLGAPPLDSHYSGIICSPRFASWTGRKKGHPDLIPFCKPEGTVMSPNSELPTTSVLFIDGSKNQRTYWAEQLRRCSPNYEIVEVSDGQSGLVIYRSQRVDCVVLELSLPDQSGWQTLVNLVPVVSMPDIAVVVLTTMTHRGVWELAKHTARMRAWQKNLRRVRIWIKPSSGRWRLWDRCPRKIGTGSSNHSRQAREHGDVSKPRTSPPFLYFSLMGTTPTERTLQRDWKVAPLTI